MHAAEPVRDQSRANPGRPFALFQDRTWTSGGFHDAIAGAARMLAAQGIRKGDRVGIMAVIVPKPGAKLTAQDVGRWCAQRLAAHKVPRFVVFVDELPHTPTHKVAKFLLKQDPALRAGAVDLTSSP